MAATPKTKAGPNNALPEYYELGEYIIESVLGHGGFGITYLAQDTQLSSQVAIKEYFPQTYALRNTESTIVPNTDSGPTAQENYQWGLQEFLKEARSLAKFKHPHIVRVLRFLEANGTAYMVMDYEEGQSLSEYLKSHGGYLDESMFLKVFIPILSGLQAVHDAGLLHLDIKPDNIYLRSNGKPMLIDFGSAHNTRRDDPKKKIALTPAYSAIEHYPNHGEKGAWTDVYSLGATLYRCITGKPPADAMKRFQAIEAESEDPLTPATELERPHYSSYIRECVDWAMALNPEDRPQSAFALQQGLMGKGKAAAAQAKRSETAASLNSGYMGITRVTTEMPKPKRGFWEKTLFSMLFISTMLVILLLTGVVSFSQIDQWTQLAGSKLNQIATKAEQQLLGQGPEQPATEVDPAPEALEPAAPAPFNTNKVLAHTLMGHRNWIQSLAFLRDGRVLASASVDGVVKIWDVEAGTLLRTLDNKRHAAGIMAASANGKWLATPIINNTILLWNAEEKQPGGRLLGHQAAIKNLVFSQDGSMLASSSSDNNILIWDLESRKVLHRIAQVDDEILTLAFSPNGRWLASGSADGTIKYWSTAKGKELGSFVAHDEKVNSVTFSPNGKWLASGGPKSLLKLWDTEGKGRDLAVVQVPEVIYSVNFSHDSNWLIAGGSNNAVLIWDTHNGELVQQLNGHEVADIYATAISVDGKYIASGGRDNTVRIWATIEPKPIDAAASAP